MLSGPRQLVSAEQAFGYFLHDYLYDPSHRATNRWHGRGARLLGLPGRIGKRVFTAILSGHVPGTDIRLGRVLAGKHQHRPGWDLTFSAPKSVSLEALLHGERRVMRAHDRAVRETLDWIETEFLQTRGYDPRTGKRPREAAGGMIAATFRHVASRGNDPQLHTHVVLANMTRSQGGDWRSVEPVLLMRNRRLIGTWYRNALARILGEAGYRLVPTTIGGLPGFELAGYSQAHLDAFSTRRQDILRYMAEEGLDYSPASAQRAALASRPGKKEPPIKVLARMWQRLAKAIGLARDPAAVRRGKAARKRRAPPRFSALEAAFQALEHLEERHAVFRPQDLLATALGRDPGRHSHTGLEAAIGRLEKDGHLVRTKAGDFTTRRTLRAEKEVVSLMREGCGRARPLADRAEVDAHLGEASLTCGQRQAAGRILLSEDRVIGVQGFAGTGKTRMLNEIVRLAGEERVFGLAPSSAAARVLGVEAGIGATTLQWLLARYGSIAEGTASGAELRKAREHFAGSIVIVDESSMVGTVQMQALLRIAGALDFGRLVLVGDTLQLKAVSAGQPFRLLQKAGMETSRMDDILRQRSADLKGAVAHMVEGDPDLAMASLGGDVRELPPDALAGTAARLWLGLPAAAREDTAILAPTHALREEINAVIREGLADEGVLRGRSLEIMRLVDRRLTRVLAADPASYREGDVVVAGRDVYGLREGEAWTVTGAGGGRVEMARKGIPGGFRPSGNAAGNVSVHETRPMSIMAGDEIVFTRNLKRRKIINGERARIEAITGGRVRIRLASGRGLSFGVDDDDLGHIDHAWSSTVHRAQGLTKDNVIAVLDATSMMSDRAMLYVEMSRARDGFVLLTDDTEQLVHRLGKEGETHSALEETGQESWLTPDPAGKVSDREPVCAALHDWRALAVEARKAGRPVSDMEGCEGLMARIRRRGERDPQMPVELARALTDHGRFTADRRRVAGWAELAASVSAGRARLLAAARDANTGLRGVGGYARWREDAARAVAEAAEILAGGERYRQHMDGAARLEERIRDLERACRTDDRAGELLAAIGDSGMDDALAAGIAELEGKAREGEMPDALAAARSGYMEHLRQERLAGEYSAVLDALAGERRCLLAGSEGPVAGHADYAGWRRRLEDALGQAPELQAGEFRDAVAAGTDEVRSLVELDQDVARLHAWWEQHVEGSKRIGAHPFSAELAESIIGDISRTPASALPPAMQGLPEAFGQFRQDRDRAQWLLDIAFSLHERREALLELANAGGLALPDVGGHGEWTADGEWAIAEARELLADPARFGIHIGDARQTVLGEVLDGFGRDREFDRRAGEIQRQLAGGAPGEGVVDEIRELEAKARPGELPPGLAGMLAGHEARKTLEGLMAERGRMLTETTLPIAVTNVWRSWQKRVNAALEDFEAMELPGCEFGGALAKAAKEARSLIQLDQEVARLHNAWHAHEARAELEGVHPFSTDQAESIIGDISRTPASALPPAMQGLPEAFDEFRKDWARKAINTAFGLARRRQALLEWALAGELAPADTPGHDKWARDGERAAAETRKLLADPARYGIHIDDAEQTELRDALAGFERAREFDRRAGELAQKLAAGEEVLAGIRELTSEARAGELPPVLVDVLVEHDTRERAAAAEVILKGLMGERGRMQEQSFLPIAGTQVWADWEERVDEMLDELEAGLPDGAEHPFGARIRDAIARDEEAYDIWTVWQALEEKATGQDLDPASMPGHAKLMTRIAGLGDACPAVLAEVLIGHEALLAAALLAAVEAGDLGTVRELLEAGADVDARDGDDQTALHLACGQPECNPEMAAALIEAGADLDARDKDGRTPLDLARASLDFNARTVSRLAALDAGPDGLDPAARSAAGRGAAEPPGQETLFGPRRDTAQPDDSSPAPG